MYGSNPYSASGQQTSGPPQPEWRRPAATAQQRPHPSQPTPPPPPPAPPSYNPNTYGPMSAQSPVSGTAANMSPATGMDTSSWGVRYNRQQHIQTPPPLPPRPSSTPGHPPSTQPPTATSVDSTKPTLPAPQYGTGVQSSTPEHPQPWPTSTPYAYQQPASSLSGPPPPPLPPAYQTATSQPSSQPQQSSSPLYTAPAFSPPAGPPFQQSNVYSFPERPVPQSYQSEQLAASGGNPAMYSASPMTAPPVPPKTSANVIPAGPSSFSTFTPSDWEHLSPHPGNIDDESVFGSRPNTAGHATTAPDYPPSYATAAVPNAASQSTVSTPPSSVSPTIHPIHHPQDTTGTHDQFRVSPVSPGTSQDTIHDQAPPPPPPPPIRVKTDDSLYSSASESIDGVIEAWKQPLPTESTSPNVQTDPHTSAGSSTPLRQLTPLDIPQSKQQVFTPQGDSPARFENTSSERDNLPLPSSPHPRQIDPYEDLDPWSKSSLERYVAMLRKEAVADSDTERYKIFTAFMAKETKLREILYNVDSAEDAAQAPTPVTQPPAQKLSPVTDPMDSGLIPVESEEIEESGSDTPEEPEDGKYSPGGRPIIPRLHTPKTTSVRRSASNPGGPKYGPERLVQGQFSRSTSVPPTNDSIHKQEHSPLTTHPPRPIYTPFSYTEGPQRGSDQLSFDLPAYQAYSALRQASAASGRVMSNAPNSSSATTSPTVPSSAAQNQDDETFIGLIREKSVAYRKPATRRTSSPPPLPLSLRQGRPASAIDDLRSIISSPLAKQSESPWHKTTREGLGSYSNDFTFIKETVKAWETASQSRKEALDKERLHRQEESEKHIDALFNDKEIGYADINVLEEEFRQTEARVQLDEERGEFEDFEANVFKKLDKRLNDELSALRTQYESALGQLDHENSRIKDSVTDKYNLSHTMKVVNEIYQKLEVRYQKRLEIALDLERRRKKTERRPLVFMGDSAALKRLDGDFDEMERRNMLEAAKDRDERANRLMDSFDDAIMHGLGENQSLLDELSTKLSKVDATVIRSCGLADSEIEQMLNSVYNMVESLRGDSESILHSFGIVDSALNNADYQVSVAEARYSNADVDIFRQLENEKKKEDAKIQSDLQTKLESVRAGPAKITDTINDLLKAIDKDPIVEQSSSSGTATPPSHPAESLMPGPPPSAVAPRKSEESTAHQERLRRALEDAKKRNAARHNP